VHVDVGIEFDATIPDRFSAWLIRRWTRQPTRVE
jgi:hypothetical protein